jgi:uncharacterized protein Yka (UPF0111/DUF47 family)
MNMVDMISQPLVFVEHLREYTGKVCQIVELTPALMNALLATDDERARHVHEEISRLKSETDRVKGALYDQFGEMHFRASGEYALGQYLASMDKATESAEEFADAVVSRKAVIPAELHADLTALANQMLDLGGRLRNLAQAVWPPEEAVPPGAEARRVLDAIDAITESHRQVRQLEMELAGHLYGLEGRLDPATLLYLSRCSGVLRAMASEAELAADHLRILV